MRPELNQALPDPPYPADTRAKGWRFEIDTEAIQSSETWLRAKRGDVRGALLLLWSEAWQQSPCGSLPDDDELISLLIDMPVTTFAKHRTVLLRGWVKASDGLLYHETITKRVLSMLDKRENDARRAAARRARTVESGASHNGVTSESRVTHTEVRHEFDTKHQAPSTSYQAPEGKRIARGSRLPADFAPDCDLLNIERIAGLLPDGNSELRQVFAVEVMHTAQAFDQPQAIFGLHWVSLRYSSMTERLRASSAD